MHRPRQQNPGQSFYAQSRRLALPYFPPLRVIVNRCSNALVRPGYSCRQMYLFIFVHTFSTLFIRQAVRYAVNCTRGERAWWRLWSLSIVPRFWERGKMVEAQCTQAYNMLVSLESEPGETYETQ